ncbi:uncharacterized protein B0H18DRAFT_1092697 [Fomitopsis serialis]|uniref:uncharacterized protein n=1 Tax=Fomitopsis serialis TaxID=139415 RepID=UPI002008BC70|nr:uncharacterized protein B0H18DRAFT_1092697 [Neoantrodia serialis]KAH9934195.1 hypothetical protein B0H18DRAFT_1092697 [Neoantrodia serialis]
MRFAFALAVLATTLATTSATNLLERQSLPTCAETCIGSANTSGCSSSDEKCLCSSSAFVDSVESCVQSSCSAGDLSSALQAAEALCAQAGVSLSLTGSLAASATGSASASGSASGSASTRATSTTASGTHSASSSAPAATTSASGATSHSANAFAGLAAIGAVAFVL